MNIGIATAFSAMLDFYSLTSVIVQQIRMIIGAGHKPVLITMSDFNWDVPSEFLGVLEIRKAIPAFHKIDYASVEDLTPEHEELVGRIAAELDKYTDDLDAILAHDLIFTGWNLPIGLAISKVQSKCPWLHWVHSVPGGRRDYWRLPENSVIVYPNATDRVRVAEEFKTWPEKVLVIPHCHDLRDFSMRSELAKDIITKYDVFDADFVQVYPIPTDRLEAKGVPYVIKMFGKLKDLGYKVRLIIPNAWCNVDRLQREVEKMYMLGEAVGLTPRELIFTSAAYPEHNVGLPHDVIKDLMLAGNIFICPTISETFGLSLAEAAALGHLLVLNEDLPMMREVVGHYSNAIWAKFSSNFFKTQHHDEDKYLRDICLIMLHVVSTSPAFMSTNYYRQSYRREAVWQQIHQAIVFQRNQLTGTIDA